MKKILVFIDWYLPGYKAGGPIRSMANMVASLNTDLSFYVVCRNNDYLETTPYRDTKPGDWNQRSENEFVYYINNQNLSVGLLKKLINSMDFDTIYINGIYSFYYSIIPLILSKRLKFNKIIVAPRGMLSNQAFSAKKLKKKIFVSVSKLIGFYKNICFHVTSSTENADIQNLNFKPQEIVLLPNLSPIVKHLKSNKRNKIAGELKLISIARISPEKNTLFAIECLAKSKYIGKVSYHLYGSIYNKEYWKKCKELISSLPDNIEVVYKGEIENDKVISVLHEYHFLFLPSLGENFGHSILESFLAGCPVIISNTTPWLNIEDKKLGWDLDLKKELFAKVIQKALDLDDVGYQTLSNSCERFAAEVSENNELIDGYKKLLS